MRRFSSLLISFSSALLFAAAFFLSFFPSLSQIPFCGFRLLTGYPCPGCGLTHAFVALSHLRLRESIGYNAMGVVIAAWLLYIFMRATAHAVLGRESPKLLSQRGRDLIIYAFIVALMIQWVAVLLTYSA